jgi:hypothetical protein
MPIPGYEIERDEGSLYPSSKPQGGSHRRDCAGCQCLTKESSIMLRKGVRKTPTTCLVTTHSYAGGTKGMRIQLRSISANLFPLSCSDASHAPSALLRVRRCRSAAPPVGKSAFSRLLGPFTRTRSSPAALG